MDNYKKNRIVALCMGGIDSQYQSVITHEITQRFLHTDYKVLLFQSFSNHYEDDAHQFGDFNVYNLINYERVDAVVIGYLTIKRHQSIMEIFERAKSHNIPVIVVDGHIDGAFNVALGYTDAISIMTDHIIEKHHARRINFIGGTADNTVSMAREQAYKASLEAHGIPVEEKRISYGMFWGEPAKAEVVRYYETYHELPEAYVCANDSMAIGVCQAVQQLGYKVPDDVLVTGLDGIREALNYSPRITTARYNFKEVGSIVYNTIVDYFEGRRTDCVGDVTIESEVLFSASCGCEPIDYNLDNQLKRDLYSNIDFYNVFAGTLNTLIERVSGASSLEDTFQRLHEHVLRMWSYKVWFCLNEGYLNDDITTFGSMGYTTEGYEPFADCTIYREEHTCTALGRFPTADMLPNFDTELQDSANAIMFCPLHNQEHTIGYVAATYDNHFQDHLFKYSNYLKNVAMLIENSKIQSELKRTVDKLENMYIRDAMTSIYNRRGFYQLMPDLINLCVSSGRYLMVVSVDLDGLKPINDVYGHNEGDNAITTVAKTLSSIAVHDEIVSRFGGDEYVVAGICDDPSYADRYVSLLNDRLDLYNQSSNKPYKLSASSGAYCTRVSSCNDIRIDELIKLADETMYTQKNAKHYNRGR